MNSRYTLTELSGSFELAVELGESNPEPLPDTCQRALDDLIEQGMVPASASVTDLAASSSVAGMVRCSVRWVARRTNAVDQNGLSDREGKAYGDMQRLSMLLLSKLGGDVTISERELVDVDFQGKAIVVSDPDPASGAVRVKVGKA